MHAQELPHDVDGYKNPIPDPVLAVGGCTRQKAKLPGLQSAAVINVIHKTEHDLYNLRLEVHYNLGLDAGKLKERKGRGEGEGMTILWYLKKIEDGM